VTGLVEEKYDELGRLIVSSMKPSFGSLNLQLVQPPSVGSGEENRPFILQRRILIRLEDRGVCLNLDHFVLEALGKLLTRLRRPTK
jgi:hypothetical protein